MDPRLVTSVLSVVVVLLSVAHGAPEQVLDKGSPLQDLTKVSAPEDVKAATLQKTGEKKESPEQPTSLGAKLKVRFPSEVAKLPASKEDEDSVRSPRQSSPLSFGQGPHTTTVCIQVRANQGEVLCGPQVEDKNDLPSARYSYARATPQYPARYAYPDNSARAPPQYPARYAYPENYARAPPQYPARYAQQPPPPTPMGPPPTPIKIFPARRSEEEVVLKPVEQIVQQAPLRVIAAPQPLVYQRPVYQPVMSAGLFPTQTAQLLRLNCGVQSDGQLFNSPLLRSSSSSLMGYYPVGEQLVTLQDGSSSVLASGGYEVLPPSSQSPRMSSEGQSYFVSQESPYSYSSADPWSSAGYYGEAGYYPVDMQGRSAAGGFDQQYSVGYPSDEPARSLLQEEELHQSQLRLKMLQNQLRELHQRAAAEGEAQKSTPQGHEASPAHDQKKEQAARTSKRQARPKEI